LNGAENLKKIDYKKEFKKRRNQKFQTLYGRIPFLRTMGFRERQWWIRYHKLRHTWKTNFPSLEFPPDEFHTLYVVKPWDEPDYLNGYFGVNHEVNCDLHDIEILFLALGYDWIHVKLEDIIWPDIIECLYAPDEDCTECRFRFKCELKGDAWLQMG
jgi:hypothetical protein